MDIKEKLKRQKKVQFISYIEFNNKKYIKAYKMDRKGIEHYYFEIKNENTFIEVTDEELLQYFREIYEVKPSNIIE